MVVDHGTTRPRELNKILQKSVCDESLETTFIRSKRLLWVGAIMRICPHNSFPTAGNFGNALLSKKNKGGTGWEGENRPASCGEGRGSFRLFGRLENHGAKGGRAGYSIYGVQCSTENNKVGKVRA